MTTRLYLVLRLKFMQLYLHPTTRLHFMTINSEQGKTWYLEITSFCDVKPSTFFSFTNDSGARADTILNVGEYQKKSHPTRQCSSWLTSWIPQIPHLLP